MNYSWILAHWQLLVVALLWGISNPMMKRGMDRITECHVLISAGGEGVTKMAKSDQSHLKNFIMEYYYLFTRPLYVLSFTLNMCGSALFYYSLSNSGA